MTVYGIETIVCYQTKNIAFFKLQQYLPLAVLKLMRLLFLILLRTLQQYLPFTVLKPFEHIRDFDHHVQLQQYLPFTVLKPNYFINEKHIILVATVLTVCGMRRRVRGSRGAKRR